MAGASIVMVAGRPHARPQCAPTRRRPSSGRLSRSSTGSRAANVPSGRTTTTTSVKSSHRRVSGNHALYAASLAQKAIRSACSPVASRTGQGVPLRVGQHQVGDAVGQRLVRLGVDAEGATSCGHATAAAR